MPIRHMNEVYDNPSNTRLLDCELTSRLRQLMEILLADVAIDVEVVAREFGDGHRTTPRRRSSGFCSRGKVAARGRGDDAALWNCHRQCFSRNKHASAISAKIFGRRRGGDDHEAVRAELS